MTPLAILQHVIVWLPLVVGGIFLIRAGLQGRRINDHPICRRCRFDLVGLATLTSAATPDTALESGATRGRPDRCPECGTSLVGTTRRARRAVIDGERKKRWRLFALGLVLLLSGLTTGFWLSYKPLAKFPWTTWMPDWVLAEMVDSRRVAIADPVHREIVIREMLGKFDGRAAGHAVESALRAQGDHVRTWNPELGSLIELLRTRGRVGDEQWARYARQAIVLKIRVRPQVEEGQPIPWRLHEERRVGNRRSTISPWLGLSTTRPLGVTVTAQSARLSGQEEVASDLGIKSTQFGITASDVGLDLTASLNGLRPVPGIHRGAVGLSVAVFETYEPSFGDEGLKQGQERAAWEEPVEFEVEILPKGTSTVSTLLDESLTDAVRSSFRFQSFVVEPDFAGRTGIKSVITVTAPPVDLAFDVRGSLRHADGSIEELDFGTLSVAQAAEIQRSVVAPFHRRPAKGSTVTLRFIPSVAAAARTVDLTEIWGEEIIIENVPITIRDE